MRDFSVVLRELRKENGLSQKSLAENLSLTERSIRSYECKTHRPDLDTLVKMARFFEVSLDYLAGLRDER